LTTHILPKQLSIQFNSVEISFKRVLLYSEPNDRDSLNYPVSGFCLISRTPYNTIILCNFSFVLQTARLDAAIVDIMWLSRLHLKTSGNVAGSTQSA